MTTMEYSGTKTEVTGSEYAAYERDRQRHLRARDAQLGAE